MSKSLAHFEEDIIKTWRVRHNIDWISRSPSLEKAFVMAVFSKIAYLMIPDYELDHHPLAKIIPCLTYQQLLAQRPSIDISEFLRRRDFGDTFVLTSSRSVAVGIVHPSVVIIALRGTRPLYLSDWMIDFRIGRIPVYTSQQSLRLHSGFFEAVLEFVQRLESVLRKRFGALDACPPIYLTGHSLGGALAAIAFALDKQRFFSRLQGGGDVTYSLPVHSVYSFGMPRYADSTSLSVTPGPFHTLNEHDLVPSLPPTWLGYSDPLHEYLSTSGHWGALGERPAVGVRTWLSRANRGRAIRHHFVERYIRHLEKAV